MTLFERIRSQSLSSLLYEIVSFYFLFAILTATSSILANISLFLSIPAGLFAFSSLASKYSHQLYVEPNPLVRLLVCFASFAFSSLFALGFLYFMGFFLHSSEPFEQTFLAVGCGFVAYAAVMFRSFNRIAVSKHCFISYRKILFGEGTMGVIHLKPEQNKDLSDGLNVRKSMLDDVIEDALSSASEETRVLLFESHLLSNIAIRRVERIVNTKYPEWEVSEKRLLGFAKKISSYVMLISTTLKPASFRDVYSIKIAKKPR